MKHNAQSIRLEITSLVTTGLAILLMFGHAYAQEATPLEPGNPITRTAKTRDTHTYQVTLTAGQFLRILVEQNELDVSVDLVAPDNKSAHIVNATTQRGQPHSRGAWKFGVLGGAIVGVGLVATAVILARRVSLSLRRWSASCASVKSGTRRQACFSPGDHSSVSPS